MTSEGHDIADRLLGFQHPIGDYCCQIEDCPDRGKRGYGNLSFRGWGGHDRAIRMIHCKTCKRVFSERRGTAIEGLRLPIEKATAVLEHLRDGCGTRSTSRLVGVHRDTVTNYARRAGAHAEKLHDELVEVSPPHGRGATRREVGLRREEGGELRTRGEACGS